MSETKKRVFAFMCSIMMMITGLGGVAGAVVLGLYGSGYFSQEKEDENPNTPSNNPDEDSSSDPSDNTNSGDENTGSGNDKNDENENTESDNTGSGSTGGTTGGNSGDNDDTNDDDGTIKYSLNDYELLDYLESTGTQYIDTGIAPTHHRTVISAQYTNDNQNTAPFGAWGGSIYHITWYDSKWFWGIGQTENNGGAQYVCTDFHTYDYNNGGKFYIDGNLISSSIATSMNFDSTNPMWLFARNRIDIANQNAFSSSRIYSCKIYDNTTGALVRDFAPAMNVANEVGMLDLVEHKFYRNSGTGTFTFGKKISSLYDSYTTTEYIESTGTQYIDTGLTGAFVSEYRGYWNPSTLSSEQWQQSVMVGNNLTEPRNSGYLISSNNPVWEFGYGATFDSSTINNTLQTWHTVKTSTLYSDAYLEVDGQRLISKSGQSVGTDRILLLACDTGLSKNNTTALGRLGYVKIWQDGFLVRDYIPVITSSGKAGLLDRVTGSFFANAGTGEFVTSTSTSGYEILDYIESTGTQYIDTGVSGPFVSEFRGWWNPATISDAWKQSIIVGNYPGGEQRNGGYLINNSSNPQWELGYGATCDKSSTNNALQTWHTVKTSTLSSNAYLEVDGQRLISQSGQNVGSDRILLFACDAGLTENNTTALGRLGYVKIWNESGTLVRDYVPVRDVNGNVGMLDLVSGKLFTNSGTGSFKYGKNISSVCDTYTEVEYIQSSGTQYIDTGYMPNSNTRVLMSAKTNYVGSGEGYNLFFGAAAEYKNTAFESYFRIDLSRVETYYNNQVNSSVTCNSSVPVTIDYNKNVCQINVNGTISTSTFTAESFTCPTTMCIFDLNRSGTHFSSVSVGFTLYSCKIWDNDILVRDFVPVLSSWGEAGLFDRVTGSFFGNSGTGSFKFGAPVGRVAPEEYYVADYIESTGTQYIDTGFYPTENSKFDFTFSRNSDQIAEGWVQLTGSRNSYHASSAWQAAINKNNQIAVDIGTSGCGSGWNVENGTKLKIEMDKTGATVNGVFKAAAGTVSGTSNYTMWIFGCNNEGGYNPNFTGRIYQYKMWDNGILVRDYVPCVTSYGRVGLYDRVTNSFFGNSGTGTFKYGTITGKIDKTSESSTPTNPSDTTDGAYWWNNRASSFAGGDGTESDPYQIATAEQLALLSWNTSYNVANYTTYCRANYKLTADIDISAHYWNPIGTCWTGGAECGFSGNFDGGGHTITGMNCTVKSAEDPNYNAGAQFTYIGFFAEVLSNASVQAYVHDFILKDAEIHVQSFNITKTTTFIGIAMGTSVSNDSNVFSNISRVGVVDCLIECFAKHPLDTAGDPHVNCGGFVGYTRITNFSECFVTGNIKFMNFDGEIGTVGGFVGNGQNGNFSDCYFVGSISIARALRNAGGFAAMIYAQSTISRCYAFNTNLYNNFYGRESGGFVGVVDGGSSIHSSFSIFNNKVISESGNAGQFVGRIIEGNIYSSACFNPNGWATYGTVASGKTAQIKNFSDLPLAISESAADFYTSSNFLYNSSYEDYSWKGKIFACDTSEDSSYTWVKYVNHETKVNYGLPVHSWWAYPDVELTIKYNAAGTEVPTLHVDVDGKDENGNEVSFVDVANGESVTINVKYSSTQISLPFTLTTESANSNSYYISVGEKLSTNSLALGFNNSTTSTGYSQSWTPNQNLELEVNVAQRYTIFYNGNGETSGVVPATQYKMHGGESVTLHGNEIYNLQKTGYELLGWNTVYNGSGTSYGLGATYSDNADLTLYAHWKALEKNMEINIRTIESGAASTSVFGNSVKVERLLNGETVTTTCTSSTNTIKFNPNEKYKLTAECADGYAFFGFTTNSSVPTGLMDPPDNPIDKLDANADDKTVVYYAWFKYVGNNTIKYDRFGNYYFESGEYPQTYLDEMSETLETDFKAGTSGLTYLYSINYLDADGTEQSVDIYSDTNETRTASVTANLKERYANGEIPYSPTNPITKYARVEIGSSTSAGSDTSDTANRTDSQIESGVAAWFAVEPIRWQVNENLFLGEYGHTEKNTMGVTTQVIAFGKMDTSYGFGFDYSDSKLYAQIKAASANVYANTAGLQDVVSVAYANDEYNPGGASSVVGKGNPTDYTGFVIASNEEILRICGQDDTMSKCSDLVAFILSGGEKTQAYWERYCTRSFGTGVGSVYGFHEAGMGKQYKMNDIYGYRLTLTLSETTYVG